MSSRFVEEVGSAVVDFVIVLVPTSLLAIPLIELSALMHHALVTKQVAFDVARFGSLADQSGVSAHSYLRSRDSSMALYPETDGSSCFTSVSGLKTYSVTLWPFPIPIQSNAHAQCETF